MGNSVHWYLGTDEDDFIFGSSRWSKIIAGAGNDTIFANGGKDTVFAGEGDDVIRGGRRDDDLYGGAGNDAIYGGKGRDELYGGQGDDYLSGGNGRDELYGGDGHDTLSGGNGRDTLDGGEGDDHLSGDAGNDWLSGEDGHDYLTGGRGSDVLLGGAGDDALDGGQGSDRLIGGDGQDVAIYSGGIGDYSLTHLSDGSWSVTSLTDGFDNGTDVLIDIEAVYFQADDRLVYIDGRANPVHIEDDAFEVRADQSLVFDLADLFTNDFNPDGLDLDITQIDVTSTYGIDIEVVDGKIIYHTDGAFDDLVQDARLTDDFRYTVVDTSGKMHTGRVTVTVVGINDAPVLQADSFVEVWENATEVGTFKAIDPEGEAVQIDIVDTGDGALFAYDAQTKTLSFINPPDFENPSDAGGDNLYHVTLQASDVHGASTTQTITVKVKDSTEIASQPRINEIHYDDTGMDDGEFVEIRVANGYDISNLALLLYNGKEGYHNVYATITEGAFGLELASSDDTYDYYVGNAPMNGIQNGSPDGFALVNGDDVIEFLSIEGTFVAADGVAQGWMSNDIGVEEIGTTAEGMSLQRLDDDTWIGPIAHTNGYANTSDADLFA